MKLKQHLPVTRLSILYQFMHSFVKFPFMCTFARNVEEEIKDNPNTFSSIRILVFNSTQMQTFPSMKNYDYMIHIWDSMIWNLDDNYVPCAHPDLSTRIRGPSSWLTQRLKQHKLSVNAYSRSCLGKLFPAISWKKKTCINSWTRLESPKYTYRYRSFSEAFVSSMLRSDEFLNDVPWYLCHAKISLSIVRNKMSY